MLGGLNPIPKRRGFYRHPPLAPALPPAGAYARVPLDAVACQRRALLQRPGATPFRTRSFPTAFAGRVGAWPDRIAVGQEAESCEPTKAAKPSAHPKQGTPYGQLPHGNHWHRRRAHNDNSAELFRPSSEHAGKRLLSRARSQPTFGRCAGPRLWFSAVELGRCAVERKWFEQRGVKGRNYHLPSGCSLQLDSRGRGPRPRFKQPSLTNGAAPCFGTPPLTSTPGRSPVGGGDFQQFSFPDKTRISARFLQVANRPVQFFRLTHRPSRLRLPSWSIS